MPTVKLHLYNSCTNAVKRTDTLSDRVQMQTWRRWSKPFTHSPLSKYWNVSVLNRFTTSHAFSEWRWSHKMLSERVNDKYYYILHQWIHINWIPQLSNPLFSSKKRNRFKHLETKHLYERCSPLQSSPSSPFYRKYKRVRSGTMKTRFYVRESWPGPKGVIGSCQLERLYLIRAPKSII